MEVVNRPKHYDHASGFQCVDVCGHFQGFLFNAMMETAKQEGLAEFFKAEQQKVVAPSADAAQRLKL